MSRIDLGDVKVRGRSNNLINLQISKNIILTTDENNSSPTIELKHAENAINILSEKILLSSNESGNESSIVNGEQLVEILKWIIKVLKTHTHPPAGGPALPVFHLEADSYYNYMDQNLINKNIRFK